MKKNNIRQLDQPIQALFFACRAFVEKAGHLQERADRQGYEPNPDQSHFWAWLQSAVEGVEDVVKDLQATTD